MSGSSNSGGDVNTRKRKIYLIDDEIVLTENEIHFKLRLEIASKFGHDAKVESSEWFKKRGVQLLSLDVKKGVIILVPVDTPNDKEAVDETWAHTSNWYYCVVQTVNPDDTVKIEILGTMLPVEDQLLFPTGWTTETDLPEYLLTSKGKLKEIENQLITASHTAEPSGTEGETVVKANGNRSIQLFGIPDLDGISRLCSGKADGIKRMLKVGGLIRLMGTRFDRLVTDLNYNRETFMDMCQKYSETSEDLPKEALFKSFVRLPKLRGLPVQDNVETLERFLLGDYPFYDRTRISLKDFVDSRGDNFTWGRSATIYGRKALEDAFRNLQKVLVVYFGNCYDACCEDVLKILNDDDDVLQDYNDHYIQIKLEMAISMFFHDVYKEKELMNYPEMLMTTPSLCAALLKRYLYEEMQKAQGLLGAKKWETHPHSKFYAQEGTFKKVIFKKVIEKITNPVIQDKGTKKLPCIWYAAEQLRVRNAKDQVITCRKASCEWPHRSLIQCSRGELLARADSLGKLKTQYIKNVDAMVHELKNDPSISK